MVEKGFVSLKPGWARVNFNYFISDAEFEYIVAGVNLCALYGHLLVTDYQFDPVSGQWHHKDGPRHRPMRLHDIRYSSGRLEYPSRHARLPEEALGAQLVHAKTILADAARRVPEMEVSDPTLGKDYERLRWFAMPAEIVRDLKAAHGATAADPRLTMYRATLEAAYGGGRPALEQVAALAMARRLLQITPEEHVSSYDALVASAR
jgi:hypothetical protein